MNIQDIYIETDFQKEFDLLDSEYDELYYDD